MRKETDQLFFEDSAPNLDCSLSSQVRMRGIIFGNTFRRGGTNLAVNKLGPELETLEKVDKALGDAIRNAEFEMNWARTAATDWWQGRGEPHCQKEYQHALAELQELKELRQAAKVGLFRRLLRGE